MNIIEIKNLDFKYKDKEIFKNFNLTIEKGKWYSLIGSNGSGKSTLVKLLSGLIKSENIYVNGMEVKNSNLYDIRSILSIVFEDPNTNLVCETVKEELAFPLENIGKTNINRKIEEISTIFNINNILDKSISELNSSQKQLVALAAGLIIDPKILILDESFTYLTGKKKEIFNILKKFNLTIINITHDIEETLIGDNIIILNKGNLLINDKKEIVYENEKLFSEANLKLPFMIDLSNKLKYYNLINKTYYDKESMVNDLWK